MFAIAFLIGLYANGIFLLGLLNLYSQPVLVGYTLAYILLSVIFWQKFDEKLEIKAFINEVRKLWRNHPLWSLGLLIATGVMLIGALTPETAFDALWYHLTLPKLYLAFGGIRYIPGGLFYYSTMPKVGEMFYVFSQSVSTDLLAHMIHLLFALLIGIVIYVITKKYTSKYLALLSVIIFFSNIVVLWEATIAYIDLIRAFFEVMALWGVLEYFGKNDRKWLVESGLFLGLAVETKLIALSSLPIFLIALFFFGRKKWLERIQDIVLYGILTLIVSLPWFVFSYVHTGNPLYPLFTNYLSHVGQGTWVFPQILTDVVTVFITASDPVSPLYLMFVPLLILVWEKVSKRERVVVVMSGLALVAWTVTPKIGGGRFLLPYLPLLTITTGVILQKIEKKKILFQMCTVAIFLVFITAVGYRALAEVKDLSVVLGLQSRQEYLTKHLNFSYGDFYDTDAKIKKIVSNKTVLLYGFHNLYYVDFPFIDSSYVEKGDTFTYIATKDTVIPKRFGFWQPIYFDPLTKVTLYTVGQEWIY